MTGIFRKYTATLAAIMFAVMMTATVGAYAQNSDTICLVNDIKITGNKKTKQKIILCELEFGQGDTVSFRRLPEVLEKSRINLQKTSIFNYVTIDYYTYGDSIKAGTNSISVSINVEECWYTWPMFDVTPHNGNLNEWFANPDFSMIDFLIGVKRYNFLGRRQSVGIMARVGFNNVIQLSYDNVAIDKQHKHLLSFYTSIQRQNTVMLRTEDNKAKYRDFEDETKALHGYSYEISYRHRPTIDMSNLFSIGYESTSVHDSVAILNPNFFGGGRTHISGLVLSYEFRLDKRNSSYYPLVGSWLSTRIQKQGILSNSIDTYKLTLDARKYIPLFPRQYFAVQFYGSMSSYSTPFYLMEAIGYKPNIVPGYEHNMISGRCVSYVKSSYKFELIRQHIVHLKWLPLEKFNKIHYAVYLNAFANAGYTTPKTDDVLCKNDMSDTFLGALGIGVDLVTYYDRVLSAFVTHNIQGGTYVGVGFKSSF